MPTHNCHHPIITGSRNSRPTGRSLPVFVRRVSNATQSRGPTNTGRPALRRLCPRPGATRSTGNQPGTRLHPAAIKSPLPLPRTHGRVPGRQNRSKQPRYRPSALPPSPLSILPYCHLASPPDHPVPGPSRPVPSSPVHKSSPVPSTSPVQSRPVQSSPVYKSSPVPSSPVPSRPVPSRPVPSRPVPSRPVPSTSPVQSRPVPSSPVPSRPIPSRPVYKSSPVQFS